MYTINLHIIIYYIVLDVEDLLSLLSACVVFSQLYSCSLRIGVS